MGNGAKRTLIPFIYSNLDLWEKPGTSHLDEICKKAYLSRKAAVEMYAAGEKYLEITRQTGKCDQEVRRLVKRCITSDGQGSILGFSALIKGTRIEPYIKTARVDHIVGGGKGGCAGALAQFFTTFPEIEKHLQQLCFKKIDGRNFYEPDISYKALHLEFLTAAKAEVKKGTISTYDWPFNTLHAGYYALRNYIVNLRYNDAYQSIQAEASDEARHRTPIGQGKRSLLPILRPFAYVELDHNQVNSASDIILENSHGVEIVVPVDRWYFSIATELKNHGVIGAFVTLATEPNSDSVIETVQSAICPELISEGDPRGSLLLDGKALLNQLIPELAFQGFSALKLDNAWANKANESVNVTMDAVGCSINFGPTYSWWTRPLVENIFGNLEKRGLKRSPATHGTGPKDVTCNDPNGQAIRFRIKLSEIISIFYGCIREYNEATDEGLQWGSRVVTMKTAMERSQSGFFLQPLPRSVQNDPRLFAHVEICTVHGNLKKNVRPYFELDRCRYTNPELANAYWLIGKKIIAYVRRRDCRQVVAEVYDTGQNLGDMIPERRWCISAISWRDRRLLNRSGLAERHSAQVSDVTAKWIENKADDLEKKYSKNGRQSKNTKSSKDALDIARVIYSAERGTEANIGAQENSAHVAEFEQTQPAAAPVSIKHRDPFSLCNAPQINSVRKG